MSVIKILDIEKFITKNNCLEVKNAKLPSEKLGYDPLSLYSELIFGTYGSKERKTRYGYISLGCQIIHPIMYDMIKTVSDESSRILSRKKTYIVKDHKFIEDKSGETGLTFFIKNFFEVNFTTFCKKEKIEVANTIEKYKKIIIIDKWVVIPAGYRDINYRDRNSLKLISPINELYKDLLFITSQLSGDPDFDEIFIERMQHKLFQISDWFKKEKLSGKSGMFRGNIMKKRMDFTSRLILLSSPDIHMGEIGIPWHTALAIFEPIFSYHIFKKETSIIDDIKEYLETNDFGQDDFEKFVKDVVNNPDVIPDKIKNGITEIAKEVLSDQIVTVKRDPVTDRNSYFAAKPIIIPGRVAIINSLQLKPLGGDTLKGEVQVFDSNKNKSIIKLQDFPKLFKLNFLSNTEDRWVYEIIDEIYTLSIDPITFKKSYNRIKYWHVHTNVNFYSINSYLNFNSLIVGEKQSVFVFNSEKNQFEKIDIEELNNNKSRYFFAKLTGGYGSDPKSLVHSFIPATKAIIVPYNIPDYIQIDLPNLPTNLDKSRTGFDLTIDNDQKNFLHSENIFVCNSDGDQVAIVPLFSEEAKREAREKMVAGIAPNKFNSLSNYGNSIYSLWLDGVATLYKITKDPNE